VGYDFTMFGKDFWNDVTSVGSLFFYLLVLVMAFFLGQSYLGIQLAIALISCYIIGVPIKLLFFQRRPNKQTYKTLVQKFDAASFPSVHSMRVVCLAGILAFFFSSIAFSAIALGLVGAVMYSRIRLDKHYVGDIMAGAAFGVMIVALVLYFQPTSAVFAVLSFF
jgi:membrane-associated phospholipid phosphatase